MAKQHGEAAGVPRAIQSEGEDEAKVYAKGEVAPGPLHPTVEMERVHIEDPRRVPPPREGARRGGGARNPEQRAPLADAGAPSVSMPEGLAVTKRQPIVIDSEILAEWHGGRGEAAGSEAAEGEAAEGERTERGAAGREAAAADAAARSGTAADRTPRLAEVAAARRTERRAGRQRAVWVLAMGVLLAIGVTVLRAVWGASGDAGEAARGAGTAAQGEPTAAGKAHGAAAERASAASAPDASAASERRAAPGGAAASARTMPRERPAGAATTSQQGRPGGQGAAQPAAPRPSATGSAAPARGAESAPGPAPPNPDDIPNYD